METQPLNVIHLDTVTFWRGGQQQVVYLFEGMLRKKLNTALICQPDSAYQKYCECENLSYFTVRMYGEWDILAGFRISRLCKKEGFNIIHAHSAHALTIGIWAKLFNRSLTLVAARRVDFSIRKNALSIFKYHNSKVDKIVCISNRIRQVLIDDGIPEEKLITIHSGIDLNKFDDIESPKSFRQDWDIPEDHLIVGTVAALVGHKDYPNLLQAAKIVIEQFPEITFMAVGNGQDEQDIKQLAERLKLGKRFVFTGFQKEIGQFLKSFDIFVLASKLEGLGTSVLDAIAAGLPVVGTRAGGIPEMIRHNENGLLVDAQNPQALADAILELAKDKNKRDKFINNGKISIQDFQIDATVNKTIALYEGL